MSNRVQSLRSSTPGARPTGRTPGEIYTNWPDKQLGVVDASNAAQDLIGVRFFSTLGNYAAGDFVVSGGQLYRAKSTVAPGAFNSANWDLVQKASDLAPYALTANVPVASSTTPAMDGTAAAGSGTTWARGDHVHPTDTSRAPLASPVFTGKPIIPGVTDGSAAPAGSVGETMTASNTTIAVGSGGAANITSLNLTAGDWDVWGLVALAGASVAATLLMGNITTTSGAIGSPIGSSAAALQMGSAIIGNGTSIAIPPKPVNVAATTVVYLVGQANFASGTWTPSGTICARRRR